MKLVVHIGAPKTGSTAIQHALAQNREQLASAGILYPRLRMPNSNHTMLTAGIYKPEMPLGRLVRPRVNASGKSREEIYHDDLSCLKEQIAEMKPSCTVLSTEALFRLWGKMEFEKFLQDCGIPLDSVSIICYLRNPADHYLSLVQQRLKYSSTFKPPAPSAFKSVLAGYMSNLPGRVRIRKYAPGSDVVDDFMHLVAPGLQLENRDRERRNVTVSAEIMQIMQDYRRSNYPDSDGVAVPKATGLWKKLQRIEREIGTAQRPLLKSEVRQHILARARPNIEWLCKQLDWEVDWLQDAEAGAVSIKFPSKREMRVSDICEIDESYLNRLRDEATREDRSRASVSTRRPRTKFRGLQDVLGLVRRLLRGK